MNRSRLEASQPTNKYQINMVSYIFMDLGAFLGCTVKILSPLTCSFCVHWYCTDAKLWDLFAGKQYNVLLIFKLLSIFKFLINYSPLAYISLCFFVYLSSDVRGLRSPGVRIGTILNRYCERMWFLQCQYYINFIYFFTN